MTLIKFSEVAVGQKFRSQDGTIYLKLKTQHTMFGIEFNAETKTKLRNFKYDDMVELVSGEDK